MIKKLIPLFFFVTISCDDHHGGQVVKNSSKIISTQLSLVEGSPCAASSKTCTPSNLSGRIFAAGALLGKEQDGTKNYNMTFLADSEEVINNPSDPSHPEGKNTFNLESPLVFSGLISLPSEEFMPETPVITRIESYFDYIDASFSFSAVEVLAENFVVRTVMRKTAKADDVNGVMMLGDKLIRKEGESNFRWCDEVSCEHLTRPENPIQENSLLKIDEANDLQPGNPDYALYSIDLKQKQGVTVSYEEISDVTRLWTLDFDITNALSFTLVPEEFSSELDIVQNFSLEFGCNTEDCELSDNRITATLTISEAGSVGEEKASE